MSSAVYLFKQFGPRSDRHSVRALSGSRLFDTKGYDKLKLNGYILTLCFSFTWHCHLLVTICKQFGPRSSPTFCLGLIRVQTVWHFKGYDKLKLNLYILTRAVEIPCPTCPTWSHFIKDKLNISIYLSLDKYKINNTILYFIFWLIICSHLALKTVWIQIRWLLQKPADLDLHCYKSGFILFLKE